jgi:phospholipase/carboxylesterase
MKSDVIQSLEFEGWMLKVREPEVLEGAPVLVLLHGWTGNEDSMWVFANKLSKDALLIAPRGLYPSRHDFKDGYSWVDDTSIKWASITDFEISVERLDQLIDGLTRKYPADFDQISLAGFSQGAAFASVFMLSYPERVKKLALLSGFLPEGAGPSSADLGNKRVFIGHGALDETVPVENAQDASLLFQAMGAEVDLCVTEVGHRLGADCFKGFNRFFQDL